MADEFVSGRECCANRNRNRTDHGTRTENAPGEHAGHFPQLLRAVHPEDGLEPVQLLFIVRSHTG